jgi:hypothetical protein
MDGICRGTPRDCALELGTGPCELAFCDEAFDFCDENYVPASSPCDDLRFCTTMSECNGFGTCFATENVVCPPPPDTQCNFTSTCSDAMMACVPNPRSNGTICSHPSTPTCPVNDTCLGPGAGQFSVCTPPQRDFDLDGYIDARCTGNDCNDNNNTVFPGGTESTGAGTTCSDGLDNNCNGLFDCADVANCGGGGCGTGGCMCGILPACPCGTAACPVGGTGC